MNYKTCTFTLKNRKVQIICNGNTEAQKKIQRDVKEQIRFARFKEVEHFCR